MQPAIMPMNTTAGEQWEFDGVSEDGTQAFIFGFYRDPNYSFLGTGNLRAYAEFVFSDGGRYAVVDYAEESTIISCPDRGPGQPGGTRGVWKGDGFIYSFNISADMSEATIAMDSVEADAKIRLRSTTPPRYPDGTTWPVDTEHRGVSSLTVPHFYWVEPIPVAHTTVEAVIESRDVTWAGVGGHERLWGAFNWRACLDDLIIVRFHAGPFALSFWEFGSARRKGTSYPSLVLFKEGKRIFFGGETSHPRETEQDGDQGQADNFVFRKLYSDECDGITTSNLKDKATGVELILNSPVRGLQWRFVVKFRNVGFEYVLTEGMGGTGYSGTVVGGLYSENEPEWQGPAFVEIMKFPGKWWLLPDNYLE